MKRLPGTLPVPPVNPARRAFFQGFGKIGLAASAVMLFGDLPVLKAQSTAAEEDTANQIFQAAVIAEDLATTFYYNALVGPVIMNDALAGTGGTATHPSGSGNVPNVDYLRAALGQEIAHANLLRTVAALGSDYTHDPYQTFYFPSSAFSNLTDFITVLGALENAFIGAYLNAIREFSSLATRTGDRPTPNGPYGGPYSAAQLEYFAEVAASIMGVECEHRVLGQVIANANQPNNLNFESTDGLTSVYHGSNSAVAALLPFLNSSNGSAYSLATAVKNAPASQLDSSGDPPAE